MPSKVFKKGLFKQTMNRVNCVLFLMPELLELVVGVFVRCFRCYKIIKSFEKLQSVSTSAHYKYYCVKSIKSIIQSNVRTEAGKALAPFFQLDFGIEELAGA